MATAHLYETEDVAATMLYAYQVGDGKRALHAATELYVSQETDVLCNLLILSWLLRPPERTTSQCVVAILDNSVPKLALALADDQAYELPSLVPELPIPTLPPPAKPDRSCDWTHPQLTSEQACTLFRAIRTSLRNKHWQHAVFLVSPYIHEATHMVSLFRSLKFPTQFIQILQNNIYDPLTHRIVMHTFAAVCHPQANKQKYTMFTTACTLGSRGARVFSVPCEARAYWHIKPKPPTRLQMSPLHILDDDASNIWQATVKTYGIRNVDQMFVAPDDDALEAFYVACFPEDIPDEWSNEERTKSHTTTIVEDIPNPWIPAFHTCWS